MSSGVFEARLDVQPIIGLGNTLSIDGQAIVVDFAKNARAFVLLTKDPLRIPTGSSDMSRLAQLAFGMDGHSGPEPWKLLSEMDGLRTISLEKLPMMVRFADHLRPETIERVKPTELGDAFGVGYSIERVTVELVPSEIWPLNLIGLYQQPITTGIQEVLPWMDHWNRGTVTGLIRFSEDRPEPVNYLTKIDFIRR
ncbi:MAG: hypothetical protein AAFV69_12960 [Pseudomonadota bacterium]